MRDRHDLQFVSGADACAAWLYPAARDAVDDTGPAPIIVMAHGLSGTRRDRLGAFAERFAAAGIAALVFDYRGFGDSGGEPDLFEPARQLDDWRAAIAFARTLPGIDADRVATFGSSLGGGNALAAAAEDSRVVAAISQVPSLDRDSQTYSGHPEVRAKMLAVAAEGGYLPAVGQPHEAAFIRAPDAEAGWRHVVAIGEDSRWRNRVSASWLLGPPYNPIRHADTLHCPWLVCVAENDQVAKPGPAIDAARRAPTVSFAPTRGSTTSTSTTAPSTRPSSPTSSHSCAATCLVTSQTRPRRRRDSPSATGTGHRPRSDDWCDPSESI